MPRARLRVCAVGGCPVLTPVALCAPHRAERDRFQKETTPTKVVAPGERKRRADTVQRHRALFGEWCPGWGRPGHAASDLTADDVVPVMVTGRPSTSLRVLCRSCNSRRGAEDQARMTRGEFLP